MISYLFYSIHLSKIKLQFNQSIEELKEENQELLKQLESLKLKEDFYSNLYDQLEKKNTENAKLVIEIDQLKSKLIK
jgi:hypothetical protein